MYQEKPDGIHGASGELEVEKQLGISGKPEIEKDVWNLLSKVQGKCMDLQQEWRRMSERVGF